MLLLLLLLLSQHTFKLMPAPKALNWSASCIASSLRWQSTSCSVA
jgi:hypothetical protein